MDWFNWLFGRRKPLTTPSSNRIVVGECEVCHKPIRVKAHAVRTEMRLTCKCGHVNTIKKPRNDAEILSLLRQLCNAYANNDTNLIEKLEPLAQRLVKNQISTVAQRKCGEYGINWEIYVGQEPLKCIGVVLAIGVAKNISVRHIVCRHITRGLRRQRFHIWHLYN